MRVDIGASVAPGIWTGGRPWVELWLAKESNGFGGAHPLEGSGRDLPLAKAENRTPGADHNLFNKTHPGEHRSQGPDVRPGYKEGNS